MERHSVFIHEFVTGGGFAGDELPESWAAEGHAMRRALAEDFSTLDGISVVMTLDARLPDEPGPWRIVRIGPGEEPSTFASLAAECDYTLCIAPETGGILEARARIIKQVGGRSLGSSPEAIALCGDKLLTAEHLARFGINSPPSRRVFPSRDGLPRDHPYPAVVKPIDGAGSFDTYYVESPDDVPQAALQMPEAMLQPFVAGQAMSAAFLVPSEGEPWLIGLAEQRIERIGGKFSYRGGFVPARTSLPTSALSPIIEAVRSLTRSYGPPWECRPQRSALSSIDETQTRGFTPGLRGWIGVDFLWYEATNRAIVLEINPRLTTSYVGWRQVSSKRGELAKKWLDSTEIVWTDRSNFFIKFTPDGTIEREALAP